MRYSSTNKLNVFRRQKHKGPKEGRIKIEQGKLFPREETLSLKNDLGHFDKYISNKQCHCQNTNYWVNDTPGDSNSLHVEVFI